MFKLGILVQNMSLTMIAIAVLNMLLGKDLWKFYIRLWKFYIRPTTVEPSETLKPSVLNTPLKLHEHHGNIVRRYHTSVQYCRDVRVVWPVAKARRGHTLDAGRMENVPVLRMCWSVLHVANKSRPIRAVILCQCLIRKFCAQRNCIKSNRNQILFTIFLLIWIQMDVCLVPN